MDKGFDELKAMLGGYDLRIRDIEQSEAGRHPLLESRIDAAWRKIDEHGVELRALASRVDTDIKAINTRADKALLIAERLESVAKWMLGILTAVITALIIALITGRIDITIK